MRNEEEDEGRDISGMGGLICLLLLTAKYFAAVEKKIAFPYRKAMVAVVANAWNALTSSYCLIKGTNCSSSSVVVD